jgi:twitching motility protein PilT
MQKIDRFLKLMNDRGASDLHLTVGRPPMLRSSGSMEPIRFRVISEADFTEMLKPIVPDRLWDDYVRTGDIDFSHELTGVARYRVNLFRQQRGAGAAFRRRS